MQPYAHCRTLPEFHHALCGQVRTWKAEYKTQEQCQKLLFDYIRAVNVVLYSPGPDAEAQDVALVKDRLENLRAVQPHMPDEEVHEMWHDMLFPITRVFSPGQLHEIIELAWQILDQSTVALVHSATAFIDDVLGAPFAGHVLDACHPLTMYTTDTGDGMSVDSDDEAMLAEVQRLSMMDQ
jgi:hypothetical protein